MPKFYCTLFIVVCSFIIGCSRDEKIVKITDQKLSANLEKLSTENSYFKLREQFELHKNTLSLKDSLYYEAVINNIFNNPQKSNEAISTLFATPSAIVADSTAKDLYQFKLINHINLYQYSLAAETGRYLLSHFSSYLDSSELSEFNNTQKMWTALENIPEQTVTRNKDFMIPMTRDKIGLFKFDVEIGDSLLNFVFDTGANFSTIQRSLVTKLGLEVIDIDLDIAAATGKMVKGNLAIADSVVIGGLIYNNVVFLVFDDDDLSFPQIDYEIKGIIGFPVINAMEEFHITKDNQLFIPKDLTEYSYNNFALSGFIPTVAVFYGGDTLRFHFDTGATRTSLYPLFYEDYKDLIDQNYEKETFSATSAGGSVEFEGYILSDLLFTIADSRAKLDSIKLPLDFKDGKEYHGNLGQDFIKQFDEMIISFKYSSICFKNNSLTIEK